MSRAEFVIPRKRADSVKAWSGSRPHHATPCLAAPRCVCASKRFRARLFCPVQRGLSFVPGLKSFRMRSRGRTRVRCPAWNVSSLSPVLRTIFPLHTFHILYTHTHIYTYIWTLFRNVALPWNASNQRFLISFVCHGPALNNFSFSQFLGNPKHKWKLKSNWKFERAKLLIIWYNFKTLVSYLRTQSFPREQLNICIFFIRIILLCDAIIICVREEFVTSWRTSD